ncbi:MAG TPA: ELWxxDGT repeat protein [Thermoanaerobaculia bacterium]|nr:ELWxxDGT repeat protein [Thermoanaerobaculia bacterium]
MSRALLAFLLGVCAAVQAQTPYLVKDINTTNSVSPASSAPDAFSFTRFRGRTYFAASTKTTGRELWSTDDTAGGTTLVSDFVPGSASSVPSIMGVLGDQLLFRATTPDSGVELWATDGTSAGTHRIADINPGTASSSPGAPIVLGSRMLFSAVDGTHGRELWITDGTAAGTHLLKDLVDGAASSNPGTPVVFNGVVYYPAAGALWKSDGTESGTVKVASVSALRLTVAQAQLFFVGGTAAAGFELWVSDGTGSGTRMVADLAPGTRSAFDVNRSSLLAPLGNRVFFVANDDVSGRELWVSDGTAAGTRMVRDLTPGSRGTYEVVDPDLAAVGDRLFFTGWDEAHGFEPWTTDGTNAGTMLFADLTPDPTALAAAFITAAGNRLFLTGRSQPNIGGQLWATDGTLAGTRLLSSSVGLSFEGTAIDGKLYFSGDTLLNGEEPWVSDGTVEGTHLIANLAADVAPSAGPSMLTATNELLFFQATEGTLAASGLAEASLWRSDGTEAGTFKLMETGQHPEQPIGAGSMILVKVFGTSVKTFVSDGSVAGTAVDDAFRQRFGGFQIEAYFPFRDVLFARVLDRNVDATLWQTAPVLNAPATRLGGTDPAKMIEVAGRWIFTAERSLWITDGTPAGTRAFVPELGGQPGALASAAGTIYFELGDSLWKSDGTLSGTASVTKISSITEMRGAGPNLFFVDGVKLRVTDATSTSELMDFDLGGNATKNDLVALGYRIVFPQYRGGKFELWSSDGTKNGTVLLTTSTASPYAVSIEGQVFFAGRDDAHGIELWVTDGTPAGTRLLYDINPGPADSSPEELTRVRDTMFFRATTESTGSELWALPLSEARFSVSDARAGENGVARFTITLAPAQPGAMSVDYATADRTARAGEDYDAAAGTLTFAPGETSKTIDVHVRPDSALESNETFFLTLRNARIARNDGVGMIEDDDQTADLSVTSGPLGTSAKVTNLGPGAATNIDVRITSTPELTSHDCRACRIGQLLVNETGFAGSDGSTYDGQTYKSAVATAFERDPQTANNAATWVNAIDGSISMTPAFLVPGQIGTVTALPKGTFPGALPFVSSMESAIIEVASEVTKVGDVYTFQVRALAPGTSRITCAGTQNPLVAQVVAAGTTPKWPGALTVTTDLTAISIEKALTVTIVPSGTAPLTAARATGTVIVATKAGQELARRTLDGSETTLAVPVYFRALDVTPFTIAYSGDATFLPATFEKSVFVRQGNVTITGGLTSAANGAFDLSVTVEGSPVVAPTGSVAVMNGSVEIARIALQAGANGKAIARTRLTGLPASPTLTVQYLGDTLYRASSQQLRVVAERRRTARH